MECPERFELGASSSIVDIFHSLAISTQAMARATQSISAACCKRAY